MSITIPRCRGATAIATQAARWALPAPALERRDAVLDFWFRKGQWRPTEEQPLGNVEGDFGIWFGGAAELDKEITDKFKADVEKAVRGELSAWQHESPQSLLALIILLDQFALNIYREQPAGYNISEMAIPLAYMALSRKWTERVCSNMAMFMTLPIMHSEHVEDQAFNVARCPGDDFVKVHAEAVFDHGRFPGRNACHGRESTEEEKEYFKNGGEF